MPVGTGTSLYIVCYNRKCLLKRWWNETDFDPWGGPNRGESAALIDTTVPRDSSDRICYVLNLLTWGTAGTQCPTPPFFLLLRFQ
jgi:hypothetical protein